MEKICGRFRAKIVESQDLGNVHRLGSHLMVVYSQAREHLLD